MSALVYWAITAAVLVVFAGILGQRVTYIDKTGAEKTGNCLGILIDDRLRFSLTHLQTVLWALVWLSLLAAIFLARLINGIAPGEALNIKIPSEVLTLAGISGASAVVSTAVKSERTAEIREQNHPTRFSQMFMVEEGQNMDKVIDVTKFQNFFLTLIAVGAYVGMAASGLAGTAVPTGFASFNQDLLWLIGVSHATYVGGKVPKKE